MSKSLLFAAAGLALVAGLSFPQAQAHSDKTPHVHGPWEHYLFVPNRDSADVAVIDPETDTLVDRIGVGVEPHQVALSATLGRLAVSNSGDDTLSIIDLAQMQTVATLALGSVPEHMELHPDGETLAVGNIDEGSVSLVSLREGRELHRIAGLHEPHNLTFSPDGGTLYVSNLGANFVSAIDLETLRADAPLVVGTGRASASLQTEDEHQGIINITAGRDGRLGFAAFGDGDTLGIFDLSSGERVATKPTGDLPWRAFSSAGGAWMIVPNNGDRTVSVFEAQAPFREVARLQGGEDMIGVNASHDTAFVIARGSGEIIVLDLERMENAGVISMPGASPETGIITPDGDKLYVALSEADAVAVIDVANRQMTGRIENVGAAPWGAFMLGADNYCH